MDILYTTKEVAEILKVKPATLVQWRWLGKGPLFCKVGACVRYKQADIDAFLRGDNDRA